MRHSISKKTIQIFTKQEYKINFRYNMQQINSQIELNSRRIHVKQIREWKMWIKMKGLRKLDSPLARTRVCTAWAEKSAHQDYHGNLNPCSTSPINNPVFESIGTLDLTLKSPLCFSIIVVICVCWRNQNGLERERERGDEETKALEGSMGSFVR